MKRYTSSHLLVAMAFSAFLAGSAVLFFIKDSSFGSTESEKRLPALNLSSANRDASSPFLGENFRSVTTQEQFQQEERVNIAIYEGLNRGVVNITTEVVGYNWFLEPIPQEGSSGSGSIINSDGYILTNSHVVEKALKVFVTLANGKRFSGETVGIDLETDLAVLHFDPKGESLVTIPMENSATLKVGQRVLAIGNPFALERTLSAGIVSGLGRPMKNKSGLIIRNMIQTDASINPGNSGGPLINTQGKMIGINTLIYSPVHGSIGIGFAVPVKTAQRVIPDLIRYGVVRRGWIDIDPVEVTPALARFAHLPISRGLLVSRVRSGSRAQKAGIRGGDPQQAVRDGNQIIHLGGDILTAIGDQSIHTLADFYSALEPTKPGDKVKITLLRGKKELTLSLVLTKRFQQEKKSKK